MRGGGQDRRAKAVASSEGRLQLSSDKRAVYSARAPQAMSARQTLQCKPASHTPPSPLPLLRLLIPQPTHRPWGRGSCAPPSPPPCCAAQQRPAAPRPRAPQTAAAAPPPEPTAGAAGPPQRRPAVGQGGASVRWGGVEWGGVGFVQAAGVRRANAKAAANRHPCGCCCLGWRMFLQAGTATGPLTPNTSTTLSPAAEAKAAVANARLPPDRGAAHVPPGWICYNL